MSDHFEPLDFHPIDGLPDESVPFTPGLRYRAPRRRLGLLAGSAATVIALAGAGFAVGQLTSFEHEIGPGTSQSTQQDDAAPAPSTDVPAPAPAGAGQEHESD